MEKGGEEVKGNEKGTDEIIHQTAIGKGSEITR